MNRADAEAPFRGLRSKCCLPDGTFGKRALSAILPSMQIHDIESPFDAPVHLVDSCPSTMAILRALCDRGAAHGTAVMADEQTAGRGRVAGRRWESGQPGENLAISILWADGNPLPAALPLRVGLATLLAAEAAFPSLSGRLALKWPNDILADVRNLDGSFTHAPGDPLPGWRKLGGILCEGSFDRVFIGVGFNLGTMSFEGDLAAKACSVRSLREALGDRLVEDAESLRKERDRLAKALLVQLFRCLGPGYPWIAAIEKRLWNKNAPVTVEEGMAGSGRFIEGRLLGIANDGSLRLEVDGKPRTVSCGEFKET